MTSFAVNYGWTPERIAQDKSLKEKNGPSAHITPAKTYVANLERNPENDGFVSKKSEKKHTLAKVALTTLLVGLGVIVVKKNATKLKNLLGLGKKTPQHAPQVIIAEDKKILDNFHKIDKFKTESKFVTNVMESSDKYGGRSIKVDYMVDAPFKKGCVANYEGPGTIWTEIVLNDGKQVGLKYRPNQPNASIKFDEFGTFESGGLDIGLWGVKTAQEGFEAILNGLNKHGYDGAAVVAELKRLAKLM